MCLRRHVIKCASLQQSHYTTGGEEERRGEERRGEERRGEERMAKS